MEASTQRVLVVGEHRDGRRPPYLRLTDDVTGAERLANETDRIRRAVDDPGEAAYEFEFYAVAGTRLRARRDGDGPVHLVADGEVGPVAVLVRAAAALGETGARLDDPLYDEVRALVAPLVDLGTAARAGQAPADADAFFAELGRRLDDLLVQLPVGRALAEVERTPAGVGGGVAAGNGGGEPAPSTLGEVRTDGICETLCPWVDLGCCH